MTTERELVRIIMDGKVVDVFHGTFKSFNEEGCWNYTRPFTAEYCTVTVTDTAIFTDTKR